MSGRERDVVGARLASLSDDGLAAALSDLGRSIAVSEPDDLPGSVTRRLEERQQAGRPGGVARPRSWRVPAFGSIPLRRAILLAIVALLVIAGVAAALGLGLPGIRIFFGPGPSSLPLASAPAATAPGGSTSAVQSPSVAIPGGGLSLGRQVSLDEARTAAGFRIGVPGLARLGPPDAVWLDTSSPGPVVTLVWGPRAGATATDGVGLLLSEVPGRIDPAYFEKFVGPGTQLQPVDVGNAGWWISGALHEVAVLGADGNVRFETVRLAGSVLLWSSGRLTFRLETSVDLADALEIARSVR